MKRCSLDTNTSANLELESWKLTKERIEEPEVIVQQCWHFHDPQLHAETVDGKDYKLHYLQGSINKHSYYDYFDDYNITNSMLNCM